MTAPEGRARLPPSRKRSGRVRSAQRDRGDRPPHMSQLPRLRPNRHVAARREPRPPGKTGHQFPESLRESRFWASGDRCVSEVTRIPCAYFTHSVVTTTPGNSAGPTQGYLGEDQTDANQHGKWDRKLFYIHVLRIPDECGSRQGPLFGFNLGFAPFTRCEILTFSASRPIIGARRLSKRRLMRVWAFARKSFPPSEHPTYPFRFAPPVVSPESHQETHRYVGYSNQHPVRRR